VPSSDLTFALAVIGATTGGVSAITTVVTAVRDRPRVSTNVVLTTRLSGKPIVAIDVTNDGRRPTTVRKVGLYAHRASYEVFHDGESEPYGTGTGEITFTDGPVFLEAGKTVRVTMMPDIDTYGVHVDFPLRVFAVDIRGQRLWGDALPIMRMLFGDDPPLLADEPADFRALFEPPRPDLLPAQVEPSWKLWKRRELRKPSAWQRDAKPARRHRRPTL